MTDEELWAQELDLLTEKVKKNNLPHQVKNIKTFHEKVGKVLENLSVRQKIATYISKCVEVQHRKNGGTATRIRDQGNEKYRSKDNGSALKLYTESVICSPEFGPELSLAYGNRSAALFDVGDYVSAHCDIEMALKNKYPKNLEYKLHLRKAQCLIRQGLYQEALTVLDSCQASLDLAKLSEEKKNCVTRDVLAITQEASLLARQKQEQGEQQEQEQEKKKSNAEGESPPGFINSSLPHSAPKLQLVQSGDRIRGRYVLTSDRIQEGEILFSERALSSVLLPGQYSTHCHQCYLKFTAPVACKKCTQPRYCSIGCAEEAWQQHHQHECGYLDLLHSLGVGHLAIRTLYCAGLRKVMDLRHQMTSSSSAFITPSDSGQNGDQFAAMDPYTRVCSLTHHIDKLQEEEVFQYTVTAALLATYLARRTTFLYPDKSLTAIRDMDPDDDLVNYVGGLLLLHLCQLVGNAHAVTEVRETENGDVQQVRLATGIYPSASMMNHSCRTLIINQFIGNRLVVRATKQINSGEEVTNCYGPHYRRHTHQERQEMLLSQYKFRCRCTACVDRKEKVFLHQFQAMRCAHCTGPVIENICQTCDKNCDKPSISAEKVQSDLNTIMDRGLSQATLHLLVEREEEYSAVLYRHHHHLAKLRDFLAKCFADLGNYEKAAQYSRLSLETTEARFGESSIETAHEIMKYSDLLFAQIANGKTGTDFKQLPTLLTKAEGIFRLHYSATCQYCQEIREKLAALLEIGPPALANLAIK